MVKRTGKRSIVETRTGTSYQKPLDIENTIITTKLHHKREQKQESTAAALLDRDRLTVGEENMTSQR